MRRYRLALGLLVAAVAAAGVVAAIVGRSPAAVPPPVLIAEADRQPAPAFTGITGWLNSPALSVAAERGRVVLVDFWTFSCVNCVRTLPGLRALWDRYRSEGLVVVGVHSPEFDFERDPGNVAAAVRRLGVPYPVALDPAMATWNAWENRYWPAQYLVDRQGRVALIHLGEGDEPALEVAVRSLLGISGTPPPGARPRLPAEGITPELYAGGTAATEHGDALGDGESYGQPGTVVDHPATDAPARQSDAIELSGRWIDRGDRLEAAGAGHVRLRFHAGEVYVVAGSATGVPLTPTVTLDGAPVPSTERGDDLAAGRPLAASDLYHLLHALGPGSHLLDLAVPAGFTLYTFTFG